MTELPVVIRNKIKEWKLLNYEEKDWCDAFKGQNLRFRKGYKTYRKDPYWEQCCEEENISINEFFDISKSENNFWLYFDYKHMKDVFPENCQLLQDIRWKDLGLDNFSGKDSTLWIGNKGAHTPCHMDTYGCNLVAQLYGRKLWILIPPGETDAMFPSRVPYEESSIYSSHNFYTPGINILKIKNAYKIVLNPGDVLFIPKHWWHYVENLEIAVSVNVWIPLENDHESRLEEALVRHFVSNICQSLTEDSAKTLLNPNEYSLLSSPFELEALYLFVRKCKMYRKETSQISSTIQSLKQILKENGEVVKQFNANEIKIFLDNKFTCHNYSVSTSEKTEILEEKLFYPSALINSYCHPNVVISIKEKLMETC